jgi:hypothetical protein
VARDRLKARKGTSKGPAKGPAKRARNTAPPSGAARNNGPSSGYAPRQELAEILRDQSKPANARVVAARTLAEMDGHIGRHQSPPAHVATAPLASLSRDELVSELGRLRALMELGLIA